MVRGGKEGRVGVQARKGRLGHSLEVLPKMIWESRKSKEALLGYLLGKAWLAHLGRGPLTSIWPSPSWSIVEKDPMAKAALRPMSASRASALTEMRCE